LEGQKKGG